MKQCPYCKAKIEDNARFCLYCMTSLEEKEKRGLPNKQKKKWWILLLVLLGIAILIVCIVFIPRLTATNGKEVSVSNPSQTSRVLTDSSKEEASDDSSVDNANSPIPSHTANPTDHPTSEANSVDSSQTSSVVLSETPGIYDDHAPSSTVSQAKPDTAATYYYRDAKYKDDFSISTDMTNRIVITGVKTPSSTGEYVIPQTIDGKQVLAIMENAFSAANVSKTVKKVVIPTNVKTVWGFAFEGCTNLTDVYLQGDSIYMELAAFGGADKWSEPFTLHCSASCNDRNFRYYKNSARHYGAVYEEWNG